MFWAVVATTTITFGLAFMSGFFFGRESCRRGGRVV